MKVDKIDISKEKFNINLKFYYFLKFLVKAKLTNGQALKILKSAVLTSKIKIEAIITNIITEIKREIKTDSQKQILLLEILYEVNSKVDLNLFVFSLKLYLIKDLLLQEAKIRDLLDISKLEDLDPLSLEYDKITIYNPYATRINGALLSLIFFSKLENKETGFISKDSEKFVKSLSVLAIDLKKRGVEPNQIFMLMFSESINQSIISDSGSNYEDRILDVLTSIGIDENKIKKVHDKDDSSTEFDFFFELNNKTYGIGAKRTLRERYKQFIKTAQMAKIDVMIEITLGIDLTEEKVKSIRNHKVFLFVANEVYNSYEYLQNIDGVYSSKDLTIKTLSKLNT